MGLLSNLYTPHNPTLMDFIIGGQSRVDSLRDYELSAPMKQSQRDAQTAIFKSIQGGFGAPAAPTAAAAPQTAPEAAQDPYAGLVAAGQGLPTPSPMTAPASAPAAAAPARPMSAYERLRMPLAGLSLMAGKFEDANTILAPKINTVNGVAFDERTVQPGSKIGVNLTNVNGTMVDQQDPTNANRFVPEAPAKGAQPLYDAQGQQVAWRMMDGSTQAMQQAAQAQEAGVQAAQLPYVGPRAQAQAAATSPYEFVTVKGPNGEDITVAKSSAAGGTFIGQSPTQATMASDATSAQLALPKIRETAQQVIGLVKSLRENPALQTRVGLSGVVPAIPGSPGADWEAQLGQLNGQIFLQAYQDLKGAGAITEIEGQKAEAAIAALGNRKQSPEGFKRALSDLEKVMTDIQARAETRANRTTAAPQSSVAPGSVAGILSQAVPGIQVTSGYRSPEHNKAVKGVDGSLHTRGGGEALDIVLPPGVRPEVIRNVLVAQGIRPTEFLNEGNHLHVGWGAKGSGGGAPAPAQKAAPAKGGLTPPPDAIAMLRTNPALAGAFDQKYGSGQSKKFMGAR